MRQLLQDLRTREVRVERVPPPTCLAGGVLVRNAASLISSGTERSTVRLGARSLAGKAFERPDLARQLFRRVKTNGVAEVLATVRARLDASVPLGYSSAGTVLEVGEGVTGFSAGDGVACAGVGHAGHAEVSWIPANLCAAIPTPVKFEEAAAVAVGAIALHGVRVGEAVLGERVAVIGLGLVGLLAVQILKAAGCAVWGVDPDPHRVALALELGADAARENCDWESGPWSGACRRGEGADVVILTAATRSNEPIELAGRLARDRGRVVVVGDVRVDVPRELYYRKELQVRYSRSYGPGRYDPRYEQGGADYPYAFVRWTEKRNMEAFLDLVAARKVTLAPLITHRFPIEQAERAYELLSGETGEPYVGILIEYPKPEPLAKRLSIPQARHLLRPVSAATRSFRSGPAGTVRAGFIGAGSFSRVKLLPALGKLAAVEFTGIANATGISAQRVARDFGFQWCATDAGEVIADAATDVVFICTRHRSHASLAAAALAKGKHVFVEKPLCLDEAELRRVSQAHAAAGRILTVGFNRRFSPFARECRRFFAHHTGPLSILYRVHAGRLPAGHWLHDPEQGGRIVGEVCHFVDLAQFLAGSSVARVQAWSTGQRGGDEDVHIQLELSGGSRAQILYLSSGDATVAKERIEVSGGGRTAVCDDFRKSRFYYQGHCHAQRLWLQDKGHRAEVRAFIEAVARGADSPVPFEDLVSATLATFRIRESRVGGGALEV